MTIHRPRLTRDMDLDRRGHEFRYRLAAGFALDGGGVLDAACGTGYGQQFFPDGVSYIGVDIDLSELEVRRGRWCHIEADLRSWRPDFTYGAFVSFETIEHLDQYDNLISIAKQAERWAIISAPIIPTKSRNHYHVHDFEPGDLEKLMVDDQWEHYQTVQQPSEQSEIAVFRRRR